MNLVIFLISKIYHKLKIQWAQRDRAFSDRVGFFGVWTISENLL